MPLGPGKYDDLCTYVREHAKARGAMVVIFGGEKGEGFAVQADPVLALKMPDILEDMARQIRDSVNGGLK